MISVNVPCAKCKDRVDLTLDHPKILNMQSVSLIVFEHPHPVLCSNPNCRAVLVPVIGQVNDVQVGTAIKPETVQTSSIIVPGM